MTLKNNNPSVILVAKTFLTKAADLGISMTPLKLMKLVYIAQGVKLAVTGKPLFGEEIQAWRYGPVIDELYQKTKSFGKNVITSDALDIQSENECLNEIDSMVVESVLARWGTKTGPQLSTTTHQNNTPWYQVWQTEGGKFTGSDEIPHNLISQHYENLLDLAL